jgi:uracil-DNA glycosylase
LAENELQAELLKAVKALKGQVVNRDSLSVGIEWKKFRPSAVKQVKSDFKTKEEMLKKVHQEMANCHLCPLAKTRKNLVFGNGNSDAQIVFVGEAPGADEDEQGLPFVGRAGQLLTDIIKAMGLKRSDVYICNILKCRPPGNRNPLPDEINKCEPFLKKQLQIISPKIICALGTFAAKTLLKTDIPISALRGRFHLYEGIKLMPTYHPAYLLRNSSGKKPVWEDVQMIMKEIKY